MKDKIVCIVGLGYVKLFCKQKPSLKKCLRHFLLRKKKDFFGKAFKTFQKKGLVCYDPLLSKEEIKGFCVKALDNLDVKIKMDDVIVAVAHDVFKKMGFDDIAKFMNDKPVLIDVRGMLDGKEAISKGFYYKTL